MDSNNLVNMPQNDQRQIDQIKTEYESDPAKGLAHGVQKDAIQNGIGASVKNTISKACKDNWQFDFEVLDINGKPALIFWDEGTTGLIGDILSSEQIQKRSSGDGLGEDHADERLSRFLSRFESGGNTGPGSFGRGKLIFQAASKTQSILIDSLRNDDGKYIALNRLVRGTQLMQPPLPYVDKKAEKFIAQESGGALSPLKKFGTRITILEVDDEIVEAFEKSFTNPEHNESFYHMISETWWEIINMGAKINLKYNGEVKTVNLTSDLEDIISAEDGKDGFKVFKKRDIKVVCQGQKYRIKELKLIVSPNNVPSYFNEIWVQRKKMKIGCIKKGINIHGKIANKITGYVRLDEKLENEFQNAEGTTHYSFNLRVAALKDVREIIKKEVEEFQKVLGFKAENTEKKLKNELNNALNELNEMAKDLGLPTDFAKGRQENGVSLTIKSLVLPNKGTNRVDFGQGIGPVEYQINNASGAPIFGQLDVYFEQGKIKQEICSETELFIDSSNSQSIKIGVQGLDEDLFKNESMILVRAKLYKKDSTNLHAQVSRSIWLGIDPPKSSDYLCEIKLDGLQLPREETRRVELGELIRNGGFTISNNQNKDIKLNIDVKIRKSKSSDSDVIELATLKEEREFCISALSDYKFDLDNIEVSSDIFSNIFDSAATAESRKCEIFYSVRFAQTYEDLNVLKGEHACHKKTQDFFCGVDPAGQSIFKQIQNIDAKDDYRRAHTSGSSSEGYSFYLNSAHPSFKWVQTQDIEVRDSYYQEQMIFHACKLALKDEVFDGPLASFKERITDLELAQHELVENFDEILGMILKNIKG